MAHACVNCAALCHCELGEANKYDCSMCDDCQDERDDDLGYYDGDEDEDVEDWQ
jgi:hypothetical protein